MLAEWRETQAILLYSIPAASSGEHACCADDVAELDFLRLNQREACVAGDAALARTRTKHPTILSAPRRLRASPGDNSFVFIGSAVG